MKTRDDEPAMERLRSTPGRIGPERGLLYESRKYHRLILHPSVPARYHPPERHHAYRLQFWDCLLVARSFGVRDGSLVNPETGQPTEYRFFGVMDPVDAELAPEWVGGSLYAGQIIALGMKNRTVKVRVNPRMGKSPLLDLSGKWLPDEAQ